MTKAGKRLIKAASIVNAPETITMTHCIPGDWYVSNRRMKTYKGRADEDGVAVLVRLPDGDDTVH